MQITVSVSTFGLEYRGNGQKYNKWNETFYQSYQTDRNKISQRQVTQRLSVYKLKVCPILLRTRRDWLVVAGKEDKVSITRGVLLWGMNDFSIWQFCKTVYHRPSSDYGASGKLITTIASSIGEGLMVVLIGRRGATHHLIRDIIFF